jgi:hypothetical protein
MKIAIVAAALWVASAAYILRWFAGASRRAEYEGRP